MRFGAIIDIMRVEIKSHSQLPVLYSDILEGYAEALNSYACDGNSEQCEKTDIDGSCFCGFIESLWCSDEPMIERSVFAYFIEQTDMTSEQFEEFYSNYVYNWFCEQNLAERRAIADEAQSTKGEEGYRLWKKWQDMCKNYKYEAECVIGKN